MKEKIKIIPLGGLNEIGKNMTAIEIGDDIIVIDCGLAFPDGDMLGVDLVIPDISYLKRNRAKIRAFAITHGHEDHIGAIPYVLREINVPVYCTKLAAGIIGIKLEEHKMTDKVNIKLVSAGDTVTLGKCKVEFVRTNHSIADSVAVVIHTALGAIVHMGDFKIDLTPAGGEPIDLARFGELGKNGVLALLSDSTNAERPGYTMSESKVNASLDAQFKNCEKRIIVASFASNIYRVQQIMDLALRHGRKVALSGRSLENIMDVAIKLGYMRIPKDLLIDLNQASRHPMEKLVVVTTGSQGETMSALYRMAFSGHKQIEVGSNDKIIISASPIPGNEKSVVRMVDELFKKGAEVVYDRLAEVHASGHACQEELKILMALTKPKYFIPVHGEYRMLQIHANLAASMGIPQKNIFITEIGKPVELSERGGRLLNPVPAGKVLVDGLGVGDIGTAVLRDRKHLSQDGLIVVVLTLDRKKGVVAAGPDIISRGFIFVKDAEDLMEKIRSLCANVLHECLKKNVRDWSTIKTKLKDEVAEYLYKYTKRSPMILPVIMEI